MKIDLEEILANILFWLLLTMVIFSLQNCGARKKDERTQTETVSEICQSENIKQTNTEINTVQYLDVSKLNISLKPVDETQPMQLINGKDTITTVNASIAIQNEKDKSKTTSSEEKKEAEKTNASSQKQTDKTLDQRSTHREEKKGNPWNWVAIIFSLAAVALVYFKWPIILSRLKKAFT